LISWLSKVKNLIELSIRANLSVLSILVSILTFSQNLEIKELNGLIINDEIEKSGIVIINKTSGGSTITNNDGFFRIGVRLNDSLYIRSVQIKDYFMSVNENIINSDSLRIYLDQKVNELKNVTVTPYNLSGNLISDIKKIDKNEIINFDDVGIPGFKGEREEKIAYDNNAQVLLNVLLLPLMPLNIEGAYKQLSGYYKMLKMARGLEKRYNTIESIIQFYGINYFTERFRLKEEEIYEFVLGAAENYDLEFDFINSNHGLILLNLDKFYESISN
tara:strand:- start:6373 stop:7197 length:825 start_codon:yes stop_codon:yes gene_type:complete